MKWMGDDSKEIANRLHWPHSLLPDIPSEIKRVYHGCVPLTSTILRDINRGTLILEINPQTGMPRMKIVECSINTKYKNGDWVWLVTNDHNLRKFRVSGINQQISKELSGQSGVVVQDRITNVYHLVNERGCSVRGYWSAFEYELYPTEQSARRQIADELKDEIDRRDQEILDLQRKRNKNFNRLKKLVKEAQDAAKETSAKQETDEALPQ